MVRPYYDLNFVEVPQSKRITSPVLKTSTGVDIEKVERLNTEARLNKGTIVRHCSEPSDAEIAAARAPSSEKPVISNQLAAVIRHQRP